MASILDVSIQNIKYFGPAAVKKLAKLKIKTVRDLLYHFPFRYEDFSNFTPIADLKPNSQATVHGTILNAKNIQIFRRHMVLTEIIAEDDSGAIKSVWFNQPYLLNQFKPGRQLNLSGKVVLNKKQLCFSNPAYEITSYGESASWRNNKKESLHTGRLVPIYPETYGLTSRWLRLGIKPLLRFVNQIPDVLPNELKKTYHLSNLGHALSQIHFPDTIEKAEIARRRFAFEEIFILQLFMGLERLKFQKQMASVLKFDEKMAKKFVNKLPFKLTDGQKKAAWQIIQDIGRNQPMNRLLEGDVGSGKTIVAAMAAYLAVLNGYQVAFMAPTEILSRQHYEKIWPLLKKFSAKGGSASGGKISTGLLTSTEAKIGDKKISKKELIKKIEAGEISIVIGTHSLIQKNVRFKNLALVVIDEQHRFGVNQRAALLAQHATPSTDS
ncbi:MAG: DEAD/DEAH box helicase, partial [Patescibacteria group bacterium]